MGYESLEGTNTYSKKPRIATDEVRIGIKTFKSPMLKKPVARIVIHFGKAVAARAGIADGNLLNVGFGTDADAGKIRITRDNRSNIQAKWSDRFQRFQCSCKLPSIAEDDSPKTDFETARFETLQVGANDRMIAVYLPFNLKQALGMTAKAAGK